MGKERMAFRPADAGDAEAIIAVAETSGLFGPDDMAVFAPMIREGAGSAHWWVLGEQPQGATMAEPEAFADAVWNLRFIAILPDARRSGLGALLLQGAEQAVQAMGARMLLVDTAGSADFEGVRAFYRAQGYAEEARIRDYYGEGVDKVTFRKAM